MIYLIIFCVIIGVYERSKYNILLNTFIISSAGDWWFVYTGGNDLELWPFSRLCFESSDRVAAVVPGARRHPPSLQVAADWHRSRRLPLLAPSGGAAHQAGRPDAESAAGAARTDHHGNGNGDETLHGSLCTHRQQVSTQWYEISRLYLWATLQYHLPG